MSTISKHPLIEYAAAESRSLEEIAKAAGCSRMSLYRLMAGEQNATIGLLQRVSAATGGKVPVSAFMPPELTPESFDELVSAVPAQREQVAS